MSSSNDERTRDHQTEAISPLSNRFLVAHSSPVHDGNGESVPRLHDESFQSSSSTSNSKSSSSTTSRSSRLQVLLMQHHHNHHSAVNSPLMYSRCTSLGSLASYDIRSSCNDSYTSECSSVKPSGLISPSDIPDSPPCEPEILFDDEINEQTHLPVPTTRPVNRTLTMNTTSSQNRTTMMSETVIEKTFIYQHQQQTASIATTTTNNNRSVPFNDFDDDEHLDEVIVYSYETTEMHQNHLSKNSYNNDLIFDDDSYRVFTTQTDENESFIDENPPIDGSFQDIVDSALPYENLSVIAEESSFVDEFTSNDENNSIRILYDLIKKPHWTRKANPTTAQQQQQQQHSMEDNSSISSNPSSLSLDSISGNQSDDEDEYDQEKGRQLIQRLIEETLARRSVTTDFLHSTSCGLSPSNIPTTTTTRTASSTSIKSCTCATTKTTIPQRSQSSPARSSSTTILDENKRSLPLMSKTKDKIVPQTRSSFLRLRQAQQNKRIHQHDKRV